MRRLTSYIRFVFRFKVKVTLRAMWRPALCAVCHEYRRRKEIVVTLGFTPGDPGHCCIYCVRDNDGLGKFESYKTHGDEPDYSELGTALILHAWASEADDFMSPEWGYLAMFQTGHLQGGYIYIEDDRGFVTFDEYTSAKSLQKAWDDLYDSGAGATEDDAYISWHRGEYSVSFSGSHLGNYETERRARAAVSLEMRKTGFYPSVWTVSDHGNLCPISVW